MAITKTKKYKKKRKKQARNSQSASNKQQVTTEITEGGANSDKPDKYYDEIVPYRSKYSTPQDFGKDTYNLKAVSYTGVGGGKRNV